jgi:hypothetical protein
MTKQNIDFSNSIIYKIVCKDLNIKDCYIGHTTNFTQRKNRHKTSSYTKNFKLYQFIRENGGWDNWDMIMVEKFSCDDLLDAHKKEREYIEKLNGNLNCIRPTINKEEKNIFLKEYYIKNKEKFKEYKNNNIEKINEYQNEYRQNNKEKMKEYLENNKEKIKENRKIKINCDYCKKEMCKDSIYKHLKVCKFKF